MAEHSEKLSPSASKRWLACPGSVREILTTGVVKTTSVDAERGTLQHEYAEQLYAELIEPHPSEKPDDLTETEWDYNLIAHKAVVELLADATISQEWMEQQVQLNHPYQDAFGTLDLGVLDRAARKLYVIDYKFGYGEVRPDWNPQLMIYALGLIQGYNLYQAIDEIVLTIVQPKLTKNARIFSLSKKELQDWYLEVLIPAMDTVLAGEGDLVPGEHCASTFCPLSGRCPKQEQNIIDAMNEYFDDGGEELVMPDPGDGARISRLLALAELAEPFFKTARGLAQDLLMQGTKVPGWKLVHGRSNRAWADPEAADTFLRNQKLKEKERYNYTLISPAQAEKALRDKLGESARTKSRFEALVTKPEGALTLVKDSDSRPSPALESVTAAVDELYAENLVDDLI